MSQINLAEQSPEIPINQFRQPLRFFEVRLFVLRRACKFAGSAKGFKMETAIQLIDNLDVRVFSTTEIKEQVKRNPIPIAFEDTGLKKYQENAFVNAYVYIMKKTYRSDDM